MRDYDGIETVDEEQTVQSAVTAAISKMQSMLMGGDFKMTVGDFIRLMEFQKQLLADNITEVKITWVDPLDETDCVNKL